MMEVEEVAPNTFLMRSPTDPLHKAATAAGLSWELKDHGMDARPRYEVSVERSESVGGWSLAPTKIAIGTDLRVVVQSAVTAIQKMAPQIAKKVTEGTPDEPDGITIAGGVGSDGTVTALRVERDGTVRLHPDDIEAIAKRVHKLVARDIELVVSAIE